MASSVDSACSEKKRKASQSKLSSFFSLEKRQKGESNAAGEEVQSELSTSVNSKQRKSGFDSTWLKDFPWLETTINHYSGSDNHNGMLCKLCRKHNQRPQRVRQGFAVWVDVPCFNFKRETNHHNVAVNMEVQRGLTAVDGGIEGAFKEVLSAERRAFIGHLKCTYWLIKAEVSQVLPNFT